MDGRHRRSALLCSNLSDLIVIRAYRVKLADKDSCHEQSEELRPAFSQSRHHGTSSDGRSHLGKSLYIILPLADYLQAFFSTHDNTVARQVGLARNVASRSRNELPQLEYTQATEAHQS